MTTLRTGAIALVVVHLLPRSGRAAEPEPCVGRPTLRLRAEGLTPELRARLGAHVRSSLDARGIDVCVVEDDSSPATLATIASLTVTAASPEAASATIAIDDAVTIKRVSRELDLAAVPLDGRPLTIALALDELLRASWAELLLDDAARRISAPPRVAVDAVTPRTNRSARALLTRPSWDVGGALAFEHFGAGHDQIGVDVAGAWIPWRWLGGQLRAGLREGFAVDAPRGAVDATALTLAAGLRVPFFPIEGRAGVDVLGEAVFTHVRFVADVAMPATRGNERTVDARYIQLSLRGWLTLRAPLRGFVQLGGGVPLHTAYASDGAVRVTGLGGPLLAGQVGTSFAF